MSILAAAASSSSYSAVAQLLAGGAATTPGIPPIGQAAGSDPGTSSNPTDTVDLSDRAKAVLAQAQKDQVLAQQLQTFVESNRPSGGAGKNSASGSSAQGSSTSGQGTGDVMQEFYQLTGQTTAASTDSGSSDTGQTDSVAQSFDNAVFPGVFVPTKRMATSLTVGGFTVSVQSDPSRLF